MGLSGIAAQRRLRRRTEGVGEGGSGSRRGSSAQSGMVAKKILETLSDITTPLNDQRDRPASVRWDDHRISTGPNGGLVIRKNSVETSGKQMLLKDDIRENRKEYITEKPGPMQPHSILKRSRDIIDENEIVEEREKDIERSREGKISRQRVSERGEYGLSNTGEVVWGTTSSVKGKTDIGGAVQGVGNLGSKNTVKEGRKSVNFSTSVSSNVGTVQTEKKSNDQDDEFQFHSPSVPAGLSEEDLEEMQDHDDEERVMKRTPAIRFVFSPPRLASTRSVPTTPVSDRDGRSSIAERQQTPYKPAGSVTIPSTTPLSTLISVNTENISNINTGGSIWDMCKKNDTIKCSVCLVPNDKKAIKCVACESTLPSAESGNGGVGAKTGDSAASFASFGSVSVGLGGASSVSSSLKTPSASTSSFGTTSSAGVAGSIGTSGFSFGGPPIASSAVVPSSQLQSEVAVGTSPAPGKISFGTPAPAATASSLSLSTSNAGKSESGAITTAFGGFSASSSFQFGSVPSQSPVGQTSTASSSVSVASSTSSFKFGSSSSVQDTVGSKKEFSSSSLTIEATKTNDSFNKLGTGVSFGFSDKSQGEERRGQDGATGHVGTKSASFGFQVTQPDKTNGSDPSASSLSVPGSTSLGMAGVIPNTSLSGAKSFGGLSTSQSSLISQDKDSDSGFVSNKRRSDGDNESASKIPAITSFSTTLGTGSGFGATSNTSFSGFGSTPVATANTQNTVIEKATDEKKSKDESMRTNPFGSATSFGFKSSSVASSNAQPAGSTSSGAMEKFSSESDTKSVGFGASPLFGFTASGSGSTAVFTGASTTLASVSTSLSKTEPSNTSATATTTGLVVPSFSFSSTSVSSIPSMTFGAQSLTASTSNASSSNTLHPLTVVQSFGSSTSPVPPFSRSADSPGGTMDTGYSADGGAAASFSTQPTALSFSGSGGFGSTSSSAGGFGMTSASGGFGTTSSSGGFGTTPMSQTTPSFLSGASQSSASITTASASPWSSAAPAAPAPAPVFSFGGAGGATTNTPSFEFKTAASALGATPTTNTFGTPAPTSAFGGIGSLGAASSGSNFAFGSVVPQTTQTAGASFGMTSPSPQAQSSVTGGAVSAGGSTFNVGSVEKGRRKVKAKRP
eukprot:CAMPEP_0182421822 /NCGR_PEP_ID=MMETSP1167-20130531/7329_1 /TAXON_ID=2988 /ORGANISM="Mallomonas Sp, Strain CCMP3275" /LENGTH=1134 /DNA_ID=CAMNT_0024599333 /DNA_START=345 /DNA_END=3749 /DNA_ORIENTATION=+